MMSHQAGRSFSKLFETIILPAGEDFITAETREYYDDFFLPDNEIKAQIISSKTLQGVEKKYTVYVIEVQLPFLKYIVEKRYNLFLDLYNKIDNEYSEIGLDKTTFPEKKIFGSFASKTIEHRKIHLNEFLNRLCEAYKTYKIIEFLEFLEVRKRMEMMKRNQVFEPTIKVTDPTKKASLDDQQALAYVNLLFKKPKVLSNSFKEFEKFFIEKRPKLSKRAVEVLFHGDKSMPGLIHICGKYDERTDSHLTCGNGLNFILKLLDHEYNQDAGYYNQVFASTSYKDIMNLYFEQHIQGKGFKPCKAPALKLLYIFMNHNMNMSISVILNSEETIQEYETWKLSQQTTSIKAENFTKV